ncbi:HD domain-containing phosphohydrolase [Uliginosibacterium sp. 31-16]|uniref:HD domain-containing phosphohydrolase n=1 Tax=Uliginosibacterium sp. 31-16 TaxID=3068315 RepID=UPI00273F67E8|nr:HD domain-containing phosphohydrolase [Uliginosibacterium sp. 31-16]MDP5241260.1 HD domain-containing phosphohydrolase [Uliginosibacterium sp. 31-16]
MSFGSAEKHHFKIPLHVLAAAGSTFLLLLVAFILAWNSYRSTREVISSAVDESIRHVSRSLKDKIRGILQPAENQLELLAYHQITRSTTLAERLQAVPMAAAVLASNPLMDAWYVGYANGDFVLFRPLREPTLRRIHRAPADASLMVQAVSLQGNGPRVGEFLFYDKGGRLLRRERRATYAFDPRERPWFRQALQEREAVITDPYLFYTTRQVGATLARRAESGGAVVGADATLADLGREITDLKITSGSLVAIIDPGERVVALEDAGKSVALDVSGEPRLAQVADLGMPALSAAAALPATGVERQHALVGKQEWELISVPLALRADGRALRVLMAVPDAELFGEARKLLQLQLFITLGLIVLSVPAGFWLTQRIVEPLRLLAEEAKLVASFDFRPTRLPRSRIAEVDLLTNATSQMRSTIARFLDVSAALNSEMRLERLLDVVLDDVALATQARSGALYLYEPEARVLRRSQDRTGDGSRVDYAQSLQCDADQEHPVVQVATRRCSVAGRIGQAGPELFAVALETLEKEFVGVLVLELARPVEPERKGRRDPLVAFIEALSSTAAVAIETRRLVDSQKALLEAMIQLLAGAIDAKSPYTGGHCQRVPVLTRMLAEAANDVQEGPFRDFSLSDEDREAVHIGAWLHDCGKVTTPEYVVDKATKLEALYNRIHEVRMRFEVLKRDAEVAFWKERSAGVPEPAALAGLQAVWRTLDEEFAFVAECNKGGEFLDADKIERLRLIAQRSWQRTIDDRLGLSREEERQLQDVPSARLPASEALLADKPEHRVPRPPGEIIPADNPWGFQLEVPQYKFNRGEIYNLSISRGTLTDEERYLINDHIVQTIMMLGRLPFPRHLKGVPEIAGGHHERMDGRGYPKRLSGEQMSIPARIMAIADVFEALTAADRPYKPPKTLSESLRIMARMAREQHLDADLFDLFLSSGVYREYAERFLLAEQIDAVDIAGLLSRPSATQS